MRTMASENSHGFCWQVVDSKWWPETGSNRRRRPFQGRALPLSYLALACTPVIGDRQEPPCATSTSVAPAFQGSPSLIGNQQRKRILSIAISSRTANSPSHAILSH